MANAPRRKGRSPTPASIRQSVHETHPDVAAPELPQQESQTTGSVHRDHNGIVVNFGPLPTPPPKGRLRPVIAIDRYENKKTVVIEEVVKNHVCLPVTTQFLR